MIPMTPRGTRACRRRPGRWGRARSLHRTHRVGQLRDLAHPARHALDPQLVSVQPVHEGGRLPLRPGRRNVLGVLRQESAPAPPPARRPSPAGRGSCGRRWRSPAPGPPPARPPPFPGYRTRSCVTSLRHRGRRRLEDDQVVPVDHLVVWPRPQTPAISSLFNPLILSTVVAADSSPAPRSKLLAGRVHQADHVAGRNVFWVPRTPGGEQARCRRGPRRPAPRVTTIPPRGRLAKASQRLAALHAAARRLNRGPTSSPRRMASTDPRARRWPPRWGMPARRPGGRRNLGTSSPDAAALPVSSAQNQAMASCGRTSGINRAEPVPGGGRR